jgi:LacI family transcriptional regulator
MTDRAEPDRSRAAPSMSDVAVRANVSLGTVSNVLNAPEKVSANTRARVQAAIDALGFVRNSAARTLAGGTVNSIALIVADLSNSFFVDMSKGAQTEARKLGFNLLLANSDDDFSQQDRFLDLFDEARVSGMLLAPMHDSHEGIQRVRQHGRPVVLMNYHAPDLECCTVLMDNELDGYLATRHLAEIGHSRISYVAGSDLLQPVSERRAGVRRAVAEFGLELEEIETYDVREAEGRRVGAGLANRWSGDSLRRAVVAVTDLLAAGIVDALAEDTRISIPEDFAVIGCDGNRTAWAGAIPLSTVETPGFGMGVQAMQLLFEEMKAAPGAHTHRSYVLPPTLLFRESTLGRRS